MSRAALESVGQGILGYSFDPLNSRSSNRYTQAVRELMYVIPYQFFHSFDILADLATAQLFSLFPSSVNSHHFCTNWDLRHFVGSWSSGRLTGRFRKSRTCRTLCTIPRSLFYRRRKSYWIRKERGMCPTKVHLGVRASGISLVDYVRPRLSTSPRRNLKLNYFQ